VSSLRKIYDKIIINKNVKNAENAALETCSRGHVHLKLGYYEEAIASYDKAEELWNIQGDLLSAQGRDKEASKIYSKAVGTWFSKSLVLYKLGRHDEALKLIDKTLERQTDNPELYYCKGLILFENKKYEEALKRLDTALNLNVENPNAWCCKGNILYKLGKYEEALEAFDKSIEFSNPLHFQFPRFTWIVMDPSSKIKVDASEAFYCKGCTLFELTRYEEALEALDRSLEIKPDFEDAIKFKTLCYKKLEGRKT
jgi:tetratricopeptide (TPR) repeat protein